MQGQQEKAWNAILAQMRFYVSSNGRGALSALAQELGVTRGTVSRWLSGKLKGSKVPYPQIQHMMFVLGLQPEEFFANTYAARAEGTGGAGAAGAGNLPVGYAIAAELAATSGAGTCRPYTDIAAGLREPVAQGYSAFLPPEQEAVEATAAYHQVPWLEATASMGGGSFEVSKEVKSHLSFRRDWLLSKGPIGSMVVVNVEGDSMSPTVPDGSIVLINESSTSPPVNNRVYLVCYRNEIFLKRLKVRNNIVEALISDFDDSELPVQVGEYFEILGRAVWYGKEL